LLCDIVAVVITFCSLLRSSMLSLFPYTPLCRSRAARLPRPRPGPAPSVQGPHPHLPELRAVRTGDQDRGWPRGDGQGPPPLRRQIGRATRLNSSHVSISYAVFCLKKKRI